MEDSLQEIESYFNDMEVLFEKIVQERERLIRFCRDLMAESKCATGGSAHEKQSASQNLIQDISDKIHAGSQPSTKDSEPMSSTPIKKFEIYVDQEMAKEMMTISESDLKCAFGNLDKIPIVELKKLTQKQIDEAVNLTAEKDKEDSDNDKGDESSSDSESVELIGKISTIIYTFTPRRRTSDTKQFIGKYTAP